MLRRFYSINSIYRMPCCVIPSPLAQILTQDPF